MKQKTSGKLVEVIDVYELTNPYEKQLVGCLQWGEEMPDPECFDKGSLCFPSGEDLPQCWLDEHYRDHEVLQHFTSPRSSYNKDIQQYDGIFFPEYP